MSMERVAEYELEQYREAFRGLASEELVVERGRLEGVGELEAREGYRAAVEEAAWRALSDQYRYGFRNPVWGKAEEVLKGLREEFPKGVIYLVLLGGHRSSKTEWAAWYVDRSLVGGREKRWWCADATEAASRDNQQRYIEKYLPPEWRPGESGTLHKKRLKVTKVKFTLASGFTENELILPNGSECRFKFYEQKLSTLQAVALDGFWGDELLPYEWIEEVEWRLVERNGVFIVTFTPYEGWTQTIGHFRDGAKVIEEVEADAELLPVLGRRGSGASAERVLRVEQCANPRARIVYFHSSDNPVFGNWEGVKAKAKVQPRETILMRVYGMVERGSYTQFSLFKESVHVRSVGWWKKVESEYMEEMERTLLVDPCSGRFWFMLWVACPFPRKWIVYREFPSYGHMGAYIPGYGDIGEWAKTGEPHDGEAGPAQKQRGFSLERYRKEIERLEGNEVVMERWMDARYANSPRQEREGTTTLIEQMVEVGMDFRAMVSENRILNSPDGSIDMINSALYYDVERGLGEWSEELGRINEPQLLILETCPNTIFALKNFTGKDGLHAACKDPIDCLRGMFLSCVEKRDVEMYSWRR